jgi:hypothetical protein
MEPEGPRDWNIAYCGLNCAKCPIYEASHSDDKLREDLAQHFKCEPEAIVCEGCRTEPLSRDVHWSPECKMLVCARSKGVQFCFQCDDFMCSILKKFEYDGIAHHKQTVENLKRMKEIGLDAWLEEQKRTGQPRFCP